MLASWFPGGAWLQLEPLGNCLVPPRPPAHPTRRRKPPPPLRPRCPRPPLPMTPGQRRTPRGSSGTPPCGPGPRCVEGRTFLCSCPRTSRGSACRGRTPFVCLESIWWGNPQRKATSHHRARCRRSEALLLLLPVCWLCSPCVCFFKCVSVRLSVIVSVSE